jgi:exodeoxyribonuclease VII large subunit
MIYNPLSLPTSDRYTVSDLNRATKDLLSTYFSVIQVEGEISNLSTPSSGHIYFSLKDKKAQIRCAMFKSQQRRLSFQPKNGQHLILSAQVSLYEARGDYQLIVDSMQLDGEGDLQKAFEQLKTKLLNEGLFATEKKQTLPEIPEHIGIISSPSGAAVHDVLTVLKRRFPGIPIIIYPTSVQGEQAKFEICHAIETANQQKKVNLIILARGGGSLEDLWAFNEESVARAIAKSKIPIISGIGHEVDFTIADFVADLRAATPSAAAENAVPDQQSWLNQYQAFYILLQQTIQRYLATAKQSTLWLSKRLQQQHPGQQLQRYAQTLDNQELRLNRAIDNKILQQKNQLEKQNNLLQGYKPSHKIAQSQQQLHYLHTRLNATITHKLESSQNKYKVLIQTLNAISPLATIERGYAIVSATDSSEIIRSSQQLAINDSIKTRLKQGSIISQITKINDE